MHLHVAINLILQDRLANRIHATQRELPQLTRFCGPELLNEIAEFEFRVRRDQSGGTPARAPPASFGLHEAHTLAARQSRSCAHQPHHAAADHDDVRANCALERGQGPLPSVTPKFHVAQLHYTTARQTSETLVPPNAKELDMAAFSVETGRADPGT